MKFVRVAISDFMAISRGDIDMADKGLVLIQGDNQDDPSAKSNGSGKSTIPDALCWCLYGTTARGVMGDDVMQAKSVKGRETWVCVDMLDDGVKYRIVRRRKKGKGVLDLAQWDDKSSEWIDLALGTEKETQKRLTEILGCSYEVFRAAVYSGQESLPDLPAMTDKQLKVLVEEAAGVEVLEKALTSARAWKSELQEIMQNHQTNLDQEASSCKHLKDLIEQHDISEKEWRHDKLQRLKELRRSVLDYDRQCDNARAEFEKSKEKISDIPRKKSAIESKIASLHEEDEKLEELRDDYLTLDGKIQVLHSKIEACADMIAKNKKDMANLDDQVGKPCGECGQEIKKESLTLTEQALKDKQKRLVERKKELEEQLEEKKNALKKSVETFESFKANMTDKSKWVAALERLKSLQTAHLATQETLNLLEAAKDQESKKFAELDARVNPYIARIDTCKEQLSKTLSGIAKIEKALKHIQEEYKQAVEVEKVFGPAGLRAHILDTVTPFLNDRTSEYLGTMSDGNIQAVWTTLTPTKKGELREKFSISVTNEKGGKSFAALSGGEKRKVRLATALALQDLVASRATKPIELWIGDEIDDALDSAGLERLMTILENKARERGSVFVISHNDLNDWIRNSLVVVKAGGRSVVEKAT